MPKENLITLCVPKGPSNIPFNFNYQSRNSPKLINELGSFIANICIMIPDGMVVFFPSYNYLEYVMNQWRTGTIYDRISSKKQVN